MRFISLYFGLFFLSAMCFSFFIPKNLFAQDELPAAANVNGRYSELLQILNCPDDETVYGEFAEYGYWGGGDWCGQSGLAGYWVWAAPDWYVWQERIPPETSVDGKYTDLLRVLPYPEAWATYGDFFDYGYWEGGDWCGRTGPAGYWVWVTPNWYIWAKETPRKASVNGKYSDLLHVLNCPGDRATYGEFTEYGYWNGGTWCGQRAQAGYWVWSAPNWYIWREKSPETALRAVSTGKWFLL